MLHSSREPMGLYLYYNTNNEFVENGTKPDVGFVLTLWTGSGQEDVGKE